MSAMVRTVLATAVLMGAQMASAQVEAGSVIRLGTSLPGNQGPFLGSVISGPGAGDSFLSFCLEKYETFKPGKNLYVKSVTDATMNAAGGRYGASTSDPLSASTAWLFTQFSNHTLSGYSAGSAAKANSLQNAIWYLEEEIPLRVLDGDRQAKSWVAAAQAATTGLNPSWTGLGHVRVLNLFKDAHYVHHAQDQLYMTTAVPEPETYALLLAGLGMVGAMVRRRKDKAA